ncbi:MAG: helix-turn-helix domain-containing protein [Gammaproteobacteria bacterium]|nr:helix-turn-helix domain-containing protein [Gammaproteobacteria bacterium]
MQRIERISTEELPPRERLPFWNERAGSKIAPLAVKGLGDQQFGATLFARHFPRFTMMSVRSSPAAVYSRTRPFEKGMLNLTMQRLSPASYELNGHSVRLEPGDLVLIDPDQPLKATFAQNMQLLVVRLPVVEVEKRLPKLYQMAGYKISGSTGGGAVISSFLNCAWNQMANEENDDWVEFMDGAIWPLLEMAYGAEMVVVDQRDEHPTSHNRALLAIVEKHLCDPDLDATMMARLLGVSARYVQMLFARMGTTPSAYVRNKRLDLAARMLTDNRHRRSIIDISFDTGFREQTSFYRAFRARFGISPARYRAGARGCPAAEVCSSRYPEACLPEGCKACREQG